ncbi:MAG: DeoR family transcriptional regulator [Candidatus Paceibacterales bacterium]
MVLLYILFFILILLIMLVMLRLGFWMGKHASHHNSSLSKAKKAIINKKQESRKKILELFGKQRKVTNDDVRKLLSVSDATAARYLDELQKEGKIKRNGNLGKWVTYTKPYKAHMPM